MNTNENTNRASYILNIQKIFLCAMAVYAVLIVSFYFLAGDQLHFRQSRGNLEMPTADTSAVELSGGAVIEQTFSANIQRLRTVSVQWGTYYRANSGTVTMELYDTRSNTLLMRQEFDASQIQEGQILSMSGRSPIESVYSAPLCLRVYADSLPGTSVTPLISSTAQEEGWHLFVNGEAADGTMCFSASGEDYIWTGLHYWEFSLCLGILLAIFFVLVLRKYRRSQHSYVVNALIAVQKYRFLIRQLVSRDFKTKYKRSVLGVFWSFLNPLLTMCVQYVVFSTIFKSDIPYYPAYLLIGIVSFNFFSESCGMSLTSILGNASLITKVYMPKYIYPLTRVMSSVVNLVISLIPFFLVSLATGVRFHKSAVLALFFLICLVIFSLGLGMLLSASMVFFRDTQFLWNVLSMIWMYATPIFYPESILPENFRFVLKINPLYYFLSNTRLCLLSGVSPEPFAYMQCFAIALMMLLVGSLIFRKAQDRFALYL